MKIAILGAAGWVGRTAALSLSSKTEVESLLLVDYNIRDARRFAKALSPKCRWSMADAGRGQELARLLAGVDAVANAVGPCSEYEKRILLSCAENGIGAASIGDGTLSAEEMEEIREVFIRNGAAAVTGCGMMPGWTELLDAHFLARKEDAAAAGLEKPTGRYLFCSLDRFGGYAFFRRIARYAVAAVPQPPKAPAGSYYSMGSGCLGLPPGRPAGLYRRIGVGMSALGAVGRELSAAILLWLRGALRAADHAAAVAGVWRTGDDIPDAVSLEDARGNLAGALLAEAALKLATGKVEKKGLLPLPEIMGREEAERIVSACGGRIIRWEKPGEGR